MNIDATTLDLGTQPRPGLLERLLRVFGDVRAGEAATVLLLLGNIFLILAGYYVCKTVREPLILASGGAEVKSYAAAGQALVLMLFVPLYGWFASKVDRSRLIYGVTLFFIINIELFWLGAKLGVPYLGVAFFIWVGIFNNAVIAQFWSYGNDLFSTETGERLFPLIGIGATLGSPFGSGLAERLFTMGVGAYTMLHITAVILLISMGLYWLVEKRVGSTRQQGQQGGSTAKLKGRKGGFKLLAGHRYLRLICVLLILLNLVNTTGQYVLDRYVVAEAVSRAATDAAFNKEAFLGAFYGGYLFWVNVLTVILQALLVSRIVKYLGLAGALLALPIVALGSYSTVLAGATLVVLRVAKTVENATDYSIMNTARQMLWLPTSREEKYKAKQAADTFIVRVGDLMSAGLVYVGTTVLGFHSAGFATVNIIACVLWLGVGVMLLRQYRKLAARQAVAPAAAGTG
jgi:AAA family ATP:ADP antiporter